jgi:ankyrin repeat protein
MAFRDDWFAAEKLHRAAADGDLERARDLIREGAALNSFDDIGYTPLHHAAKNSQIPMINLLLDAGADINAREEETNSNTAIALAASDCSAEIVTLLLHRGADPSVTGWMGLNAFHRADGRQDGLREEVLKVLEQQTHRR